ncbi:DUF6809 family protein [Lacrimispora sp.]|uniref:DUF6809 family protein n=1 Tax=Lacrimispora sp. TaxID=2719234 RepID=UPI003FA5BD81
MLPAGREEKLIKLLNAEERELFSSFSYAQGNLNKISVTDNFVNGFCLNYEGYH